MIGLLLGNLVPLYILIGLGYIAGRWLEVNLHSLATLAIFIISPVVAFGAILKIELNPAYLFLPVAIYLVAAFIAYLSYKTSQWHLKNNMANLIGMASGTGNTGYFGLPIVLALLGPEAVGLYMLINLAIVLNEMTFCYYIGARGHSHARESLKKVIKLPVLHAALLALLLNCLHVSMPDIFYTYWDHFTGAYVVIGMMLIGVGLSKIKIIKPDLAMLGWLFGYRFIVWPFLMFGLLMADKLVFGLYDQPVHLMLMIIGMVPLAANTVAFAGALKLPAEEAATAVLLSTVFAVFYIPVMLGLIKGLIL